jgi:hypothetical protein
MEQQVYEIEPKSLIEIYGAKYHIGPKLIDVTKVYRVIGNHWKYRFHRPYQVYIGCHFLHRLIVSASRYSNNWMLTLLSVMTFLTTKGPRLTLNPFVKMLFLFPLLSVEQKVYSNILK